MRDQQAGDNQLHLPGKLRKDCETRLRLQWPNLWQWVRDEEIWLQEKDGLIHTIHRQLRWVLWQRLRSGRVGWFSWQYFCLLSCPFLFLSFCLSFSLLHTHSLTLSCYSDSNGPCSKRTCNHHSICVESEDLAFCECPKCAEEYAPVCGSDGSTYHNVCKLQRAACQQETSIVVVEQGPCCKGKFMTN